MTDERINEIREYGIDPATQDGFRERLAYGEMPLIPNQDVHHPVPVPMAQKVKINGEWVPL